ncbi:MAG: MFS transporter [Deltaproteobacteria bacterium]|nr:MFS transporter [Deltaproteobacteria bacterium]
MPPSSDAKKLSAPGKTVYAIGDHTVNIVISAVSLLYLKFLIDHGGLSPYLAGLVIWIARIVDAFTDPGMGRLSDLTRWRSGRRRPYFLIGALPFGFFFALMWWSVPFSSEYARFAYYALVFVGLSLSMTCLSVPYLALIPEMATDYDERTSLNTYRSVAAVLGTLAAVGMKSVVDALGGDAAAWSYTTAATAVWLAAPWFAVHAVSFERPIESRHTPPGFFDAARALATHRTYQILMALYILARVAVDLIGAMLLFYFAYLIGRETDFAPTLALFLAIVIASLPVWLAFAKKRDKRTLFIAGAAWWALIQIALYFGDSSWPRWLLFTVPPLAAIGYAVAELMPWAMLGDVIDEDELETGERREGMYVGFFTFLRKIGGATAVLLMAVALELSGFEGGLDRSEQSESALFAIRAMTSLVPMGILLLAIAVAVRYPLTREAHAKTVAELERRRSARRDADSANGAA